MLHNLSFQTLPADLRDYIGVRFRAHGLDPAEAYEKLIPDTVKLAGEDAVEDFMHSKHISHIWPKSEYPDLANDLNNVILEDQYMNLARGSDVMTQTEYDYALLDNEIDASKYANNGNEFSDFDKAELTELSESAEIGDIAELAEASEALGEMDAVKAATGGAIGAGMSYAIYRALKEFLSLEGARQRGEISNSEVVERVAKIAWEAAKTGAAVGAIFGIAVMIFGSWLLIPLSIIAPFTGIKMAYSLWQSFWQGLNEEQRLELINKANEVNTKISEFFNELEKSSQSA